MKNLSFVLASQEDKSFTYLNEFNKFKKSFNGEYSILHNRYSEDDYFLSQFLLRHANKSLLVLNSEDSLYGKITNEYERFLEPDIAKYIEEKIHKKEEQKRDLEMDKNLGQLQLSIVKKMIEKEIEEVRNKKADNLAEHSFINGQVVGLQWVKHMIENIVERGNY